MHDQPMPIDAVTLDTTALPAVVAGPILRRLTRTSVTVWVALSTGSDVVLHVRRAGAATDQSLQTSPVRIGTSLWITALTMDGIDAGEFQAGQIYEYWLDSPGWGTRAPNWTTLAYLPRTLPSFQGLPATLDEFTIYHTSCRKFHGGGRDGLQLADMGLADPQEPRPTLLMLSGDQIYADEVPNPIVPRIRRVAADLVGIGETDVFTWLSTAAAREWKFEGRQDRGASDLKLTTEAGGNHLWTLGEYLACYCLQWSSALWPAMLPNWAEVDPFTDVAPPAQAGGAPLVDQALWDDQQMSVQDFRDALPDVQRALSNIPTLMIFDDHEVTDDWNLDYHWVEGVYGNAAGSRLITNALLAYLLCQHWGNKPDQFATAGTPEAQIVAAVTWDGTALHPAVRDTTVPSLLGVPSGAPAPPFPNKIRALTGMPAPIRYDYTFGAADGYPARLVVLDERSARGFTSQSDPVARLAADELDNVFAAPTAAAPFPPTIVVAPGPVLGTYLFEHYLGPFIALLPGGREFADFELWPSAVPAFLPLLRRIADCERVVILSGDVHYGSTKEFRLEEPPGTTVGRAVQATASAAKNADAKTAALQITGEFQQRTALERARTFWVYDNLSPADRAKLAQPPEATLPYDDITDIMLGRVVRAGTEQPTLFSADVAGAYGLSAPDRVFSIGPLDDETPPTGQALADLTAANATGAWDGWDATKSYAMVKALRSSDLHRIGRVYVGLAQLARVTFSISPANAITVEHRLTGAYLAGGQNMNQSTAVSFTFT
jgi:hypothetical protein